MTLNGSVGGNVNNAAGAALIQLTSGSGFFGPVPLSLTPIDLDALILDLASLNIEVDIPNLCLTCGPAGFIFPLTPLEGPVVVDLFTIDFSLVDAAGGAEGAYQASPYVSGDFWKQVLEEEEEEGEEAKAEGAPTEEVETEEQQ